MGVFEQKLDKKETHLVCFPLYGSVHPDSISHSEHMVCLTKKILPQGAWFLISSAIIYCIIGALEGIAEPVWIIYKINLI